MTEREQFEKVHCRNNRDAIRRNEVGDYVLPSIQDAYSGFLSGLEAARATPALPQVPEGMAIVPVERTFEAGALVFKNLMIEASHTAIHPHIDGVYGVFEHRLAAAKEKGE